MGGPKTDWRGSFYVGLQHKRTRTRTRLAGGFHFIKRPNVLQSVLGLDKQVMRKIQCISRPKVHILRLLQCLLRIPKSPRCASTDLCGEIEATCDMLVGGYALINDASFERLAFCHACVRFRPSALRHARRRVGGPDEVLGATFAWQHLALHFRQPETHGVSTITKSDMGVLPVLSHERYWDLSTIAHRVYDSQENQLP